MKHRTVLVLAALTLGAPLAADAQFSSDHAGVPRASLSTRGAHQGRVTWDMAGFRDGAPAGYSSAGRAHFGFGLSRRFGSWLELGGDVAVLDGSYTRAMARGTAGPEPEPGTRADPAGLFTTSLFYAARVGIKVQPLSFVAMDGSPIDLALGISYQPSLRPVIAVRHKGDSTVVSGIFGETHPEMNPVHGSV
jgi:hypothetical protein